VKKSYSKTKIVSKEKKPIYRYITNFLLISLFIILLINAYRLYSVEKDQEIEELEEIIVEHENIIPDSISEEFIKEAVQAELFLSPLVAYNNSHCNMIYQDIKELIPEHKVKSWFIDSFSGLKQSPREIYYSDQDMTMILIIDKDYAENTFFIRSVFLRNNTDGGIIKKFDC